MSGLGAAPHETDNPHRTTMSSYDTNSHVGDTRERDYDREVAAALREKIQELQEERERLMEALRDVRSRLTHVDFDDLRRAQIDAKKTADNALDGGGDDS